MALTKIKGSVVNVGELLEDELTLGDPLTPVPGWDDVPQLETGTIALGGPPGPMNQQAQKLLNRFAYLEAEGGSEKIGFVSSESGAEKQNLQSVANGIAGGIGDYSADYNLFIFCGDSTTEQMQGAGYAFDRMTIRRSAGEKWESVIGTVNFGSSGYTMNGFVSDPEATPPVISTTNQGIGNWDYYGHKPTGAISLNTAIRWRQGKADRVAWVICYGINDCILNSSVGNLTQNDISSYLAARLNKAISKINSKYPKDKIVIRIPNPMTARPYNPASGFPSPTQYPDFGQNLEADMALVEKWNQGIRGAYIAARNKFPNTIIFDTWNLVFGSSNTSLTAATQLPFLGDLVHPSGAGYVALAESLVTLLSGGFRGYTSRRAEAEARASLLSNSPWENYPSYFRDNPYYKKVAGEDGKYGLVSVGSNYIDVAVPFSVFQVAVDISKPLYLSVGERASQKFAQYSITAIGQSTRIFGISVSASIQSATLGDNVFLYQEAGNPLVARDSYVNSAVSGSREFYAGKIVAAGSGYIDFNLEQTYGRLSPKFADGILNGSLAVGGGVNSTISLSAASSVVMNGTPTQRVARILMAGDFSSYANKSAALYFGDSVPSPKVYEDVVIAGTTSASAGTQTAHAHGLGYVPRRLQLLPTSNGVIYQSAPPDSTNIYVKGSAPSLTFNAYAK